jgi:hypothetical protein
VTGSARRSWPASCWAWPCSATLAANIGYGLSYGLTGALLSGWPAVAFIGSAEMAIGMVRRTRSTTPAAEVHVPAPPAELNGHSEAARELFATDLAAGKVPGVRRIRREMHVGQPRAQQVREYLAGLAHT